MTKKLNFSIFGAAVFFIACGLYAVPAAQSGASGSFSDAQAARGGDVYGTQCASCHGLEMEGVPDLFPELTGAAFVGRWQERSVGEMFESISVTMPALDPGSLSPDQAADLVAYLLSRSGFASGSADLSTDQNTLNAIPVGAP